MFAASAVFAALVRAQVADAAEEASGRLPCVAEELALLQLPYAPPYQVPTRFAAPGPRGGRAASLAQLPAYELPAFNAEEDAAAFLFTDDHSGAPPAGNKDPPFARPPQAEGQGAWEPDAEGQGAGEPDVGADAPPDAALASGDEGSAVLGASVAGDLAAEDTSDEGPSTLLQLPSTAVTALGEQVDECAAQCTWKCDAPKCEEHCVPQCSPPVCETRCHANTDGCAMDCGKHECAVICPKAQLSLGQGLSDVKCHAVCQSPVCKLNCPQPQPCRNVCQEPACSFSCSAPEDCPAPKCEMVCAHPEHCMASTHKDLPELLQGEIRVGRFSAENGTAAMHVADRTGPRL